MKITNRERELLLYCLRLAQPQVEHRQGEIDQMIAKLEPKKAPAPTKLELENLGSLITIKGTDQCLGYLLYHDQHGCFDAHYGQVPVTKEEAETHNKLFSQTEIKGLDENCQVGQGGTFYVAAMDDHRTNRWSVRTWMGDQIAMATSKAYRLTFERGGKIFQGDRKNNEECVFFERIK